uniref:Uncharacterized protein n=1 Tax=Leptobrachium leishanense TaxID=445787 RepID=A0A8C5W8A7_9ANUR
TAAWEASHPSDGRDCPAPDASIKGSSPQYTGMEARKLDNIGSEGVLRISGEPFSICKEYQEVQVKVWRSEVYVRSGRVMIRAHQIQQCAQSRRGSTGQATMNIRVRISTFKAKQQSSTCTRIN